MALRKRVVKGFTDAYLRAERRLVVGLLRSGRMTDKEWQDITDDLEAIAEKYRNKEIGHDDFLDDRKNIQKRICREERSKNKGLTGQEARELYEEYMEGHQPVMERAYYNSGKNTFYFIYKLPVIKTRYMITGLKLQ